VNERPLFLVVGDQRRSPCDHETFQRFKLWVAESLAESTIDRYASGGVRIEHWDARATQPFPCLLNPCECGTYLPMEVEAGPMFSSAIGLAREIASVNRFRDKADPAFHGLIDALREMAELSLDTNTVLEIR
jgi:hypothetical protein